MFFILLLALGALMNCTTNSILAMNAELSAHQEESLTAALEKARAENCSICLEPLTTGNVVMFACRHMIHSAELNTLNDISDATMQPVLCPLCRKDLGTFRKPRAATAEEAAAWDRAWAAISFWRQRCIDEDMSPL